MPQLLLGLLAEPECRAAQMLSEHNVDSDVVLGKWSANEVHDATAERKLAPGAHHVLSTAEDRLHDSCPRTVGD